MLLLLYYLKRETSLILNGMHMSLLDYLLTYLLTHSLGQSHKMTFFQIIGFIAFYNKYNHHYYSNMIQDLATQSCMPFGQ